MAVIGQVLVQFVFRLSFGMALAMAGTPSRLVTSGFYRVHLWVLMGLNTFAALAIWSGRESLAGAPAVLGLAISLVLLSYAGAVAWLYERKRVGTAALLLIVAAALAAGGRSGPPNMAGLPAVADMVSSGLLLGSTMIAMLLGHWYLNTPTMQLAPLQRLIDAMTGAVVLRAVVSAGGLYAALQAGAVADTTFWIFIGFRWLAGIVGPLAMARMAAATLKIPNTQSATGILYAGVILVFLGELVSQLLSFDAPFPL